MEPPVKRRRLGEHPQLWDGDADGDDEEWEEYDEDNDNDNGEASSEQREGSVEQDDGYQLAIEKAYADNRFRATMAHIFEKYGRDFEGIGDEIDLSTGEIVVNNGHIENMRNEVDVGDVPGSHNGDTYDDHHEEGNYDDDDDGILLEDLPDDENGQYYSFKSGVNDALQDDDASQSWTSDADDTEPTPGNMQLQRLQQPFGPDSVDARPGYDPKTDGGPSLMSGLYGGGGLRYASALGEFGASPLALGPWDMLPQAQERYEFPNQDGSSSIWAPDYHFNDNEPDQRPSARARLGLSRMRPKAKRPKAPPRPWVGNGEVAPAASYKRPGEVSKQHHNNFSNRKQMMPWGDLSWVETMEESDTIDDAVFSAAEVPMSSDTGDTTDDVPQPKPTTASEPTPRIIPDSQDSYASLGNQPTQSSAKSNPPQPQKPKHRDFNSACVLSDDESPLYSPQLGSSSTNDPTKSPRALPNTSGVPTSNVNADGTVVKRGRGRPRKYPPGYRPPRTHRRKPKPSLPELPSLTRPLTVPAMPSMSFMPTMTTTPTAQPNTQQIRTETVPGVKRKRGRPRKYPLPGTMPQQTPKSPTDRQSQQPVGQDPLFQTFQPGFQQQGIQYPFAPLFQQSLFQFPQQTAYQPWHPLQQSYIQHPMFQFQQQIAQQPLQQLWKQPIVPYRPAQPQSPSQPVKRKRGRPRKYPLKFDSVYPGYVMNRKRSASKKVYEGLSSHQQLPGLQNSMTALLSGQSGRMMVSEDAWYGVARQLAQDIACLQGGSLFSSQFQAHPPASINRTSRSSPKVAERPAPLEADDEPVRVTELPEASDIEVAPTAQHSSHIENAIPTRNDRAMTDGEFVELPSIDRNVLDLAFGERPPAELDMLDNASFEPPEFGSDMIDPALIDPALTEEASMGLSTAEPSVAEPARTSTEPDTFDPACIDPALLIEDSDSPMEDDDEGFVVMQSSPRSVTGGAHPTPSPPSPPPSIRKSSPLRGKEPRTPSPAPEHNVDDHTPTSLESAKASNPLQHDPDNFDLPSSPEPFNPRIAIQDASEKGPISEPEEAVDHLPSLSIQGASDFDDSHEKSSQPSAAATATATECLVELPLTATVVTPTKKLVVREQEALAGTEKSLDLAAASVEVVPKVVDFCQRLDKGPGKPEEPVFQPPQPAERHEHGQVAPLAHTSPSPKAITRPRTPEPPKAVEVANQTPTKLSKGRSPKVPRSAERCTPIFLESPIFVKSPTRSPLKTQSPLKKQHIERRTMGELKKAILQPRQRAPPPTQAMQKPNPKLIDPRIGRPSMTAKPRTKLPDVPMLNPSKTSRIDRSSVSKPTISKSSVSNPAESKALMSQDKVSIAIKKPNSRRSLLSLVSGDGNNQDIDDEVDELGISVKSKSSSSTKTNSIRPTNVSRDKKWKSATSATDTQQRKPLGEKPRKDKQPDEEKLPKDRGKEKEKEKGKKKKRRHPDGSRSKSGSTSGRDKECGVDGYTCNRDFCFTCL